MVELVRDDERSPKGDHNRRLALGIDSDVFAEEAGITTEELRDYEMTGPDKKFDLAVAHSVGVALDRYEGNEGTTMPAMLEDAIDLDDAAPAFDRPTPIAGDVAPIRDAGPEGMRDAPDDWEPTDESADESFPASDPPANSRFN